MKPVELLSESIHHFSLSRNKKKRRNSVKSNTESLSEVISNKSRTQSNSHLSEYDTLPSVSSPFLNDSGRIIPPQVSQVSYSKHVSSSPYLTPRNNIKYDSIASQGSSQISPINVNNNTYNVNNSMEMDINEQVNKIIK